MDKTKATASVFRRFTIILMLALSVMVATPRQAQAQSGMVASFGICALTTAYPALFNTCTAIASSAIAQAIGKVIENHMDGLMTRIQILTGARLAEATMNADKANAKKGAEAQTTVDNIQSPTSSSCAVYTALGTLDGFQDTGGDSTGDSDSGGDRETPRPSLSRRGGNTVGLPMLDPESDVCVQGTNSASCQSASSEFVGNILNEEQRSTKDSSARALERSQQDAQYRPCPADDTACAAAVEAAGEAAPVPYADVQASTIFGFDTLRGTTKAARAARFNEAILYCANLMVPDNKGRVAGEMSADRAIQQAVQRAGDARVSLAITACADAVGRRQGIEFDPNNATYDWVIAAACSYRRAFTTYNFAGTRTNTLNAPNAALNQALDTACPAAQQLTGADQVANAAGMRGANNSAVRDVTSSNMYLSRLELLRIISTDMFAVPQFALHSGSANSTELQRMLIAMESVNSQLNMETLRLQEQLNLIEAASLSVDVKTK